MTEEDWTPLHGGFVNTVSQRGEVVRRRKSVASPAVHQVLTHLKARDLPLTPRLLGDDAEHEYLTYLPGTPVFRPWPEVVLNSVWLDDLGRWLQAYHHAVRGFRVEKAPFLWGPAEPTADMVVTHGDLGPWNLLHTGGRLAGVIDWDLSRYGSPLDDVAELALEAVPMHGRYAETVGTGTTQARLVARLQIFCDAYGLPEETVRQHLPAYLRLIINDVRQLAAKGTEPFLSFARGRMIETLEADLEYCHQTWL